MAAIHPVETQTEAVRCVLCQGGLSLKDGNLHNFKNHLETAHSAVFDLDFLVSIAFLEMEERERIVETVYPRVKKYFETLRSAPKKTQLAIEKRLLEDLEENTAKDTKRRKLKSSKFASLNEEQEDESIEQISVTDVPDEEEFLPIENSKEQVNDDTNAVGTEKQMESEKVLDSKCDICEKPMLRKSIRKHKQRVHQLYENTRTSIFSINQSLTEDITATDTSLEDQNDVDDQEKETENKHNTGSISCELCSKQIQRKNLRRHMKTVHVHQSKEDREDLVTLDMEEDQKCRICYAKFAVLAKLKEHVKDVHDIDYDNLESCEVQDEIPVEDLTAETIEPEDTTKEFKCDQCEASYHLKDSLRRHKRKKH